MWLNYLCTVLRSTSILFCLVLTVCCITLGDAQDLQVERIGFSGNKKNTEEHLKRALSTEVGDIASIEGILRDQQLLRNLNSVGYASARLDTTATGLEIVYEINEDPTLFPIVGLGGVSNNFWWQLGFTDFNFAGRGDALTVFYQNIDRRHNAALEYRRGYFGNSRWGGSMNIRRYASVEPFNFQNFDRQVFYQYTNSSLAASAIYNIDHRQFAEFGLTYFQEDYKKDGRHVGEITPGPTTREEPKFLLKAIHHIDRIDYTYLVLDGFANQFIAQSVYNLDGGYFFNMLLNNFRYFWKTPFRGNLATRVRLGISTNEVSPFAPFVLDSYVNIRGVGNRIDRGTAAIVWNLEYRQRIFETGLFGVQAVVFSDAGTWRNPGGPLSDLTDSDNFQHFVGVGVRLILKKAHDASIRLDYGFSARANNGDEGFVLGIGQYF